MDVINVALMNIMKIGCDRVLTSHDGGSVPYKNAVEEFGIDVELIFIRKDGWTLGCSRNFVSTAVKEGLDTSNKNLIETGSPWNWVAVLIKPSPTPISFVDFLNMGDEGLKKMLPKTHEIHNKIPQPKSFVQSVVPWISRR